MQVFLINLDRSADRLVFFSQQAEQAGIEFSRISAVDGRQLSDEELSAAVAPTYEFQPINAGEIGLFMSHKRAWEQLVASGEPHAAIFEDDAVLAPTLHRVFANLDSEQPDFDVVKLETTLRRVVCSGEMTTLSCGSTLQRLLSWHGGTAGYVISASCAKRMLKHKELLADPVDQVMFNPMSQYSSELNIQQLAPAACIQKDILEKENDDAFGTTIDRNVTGGKLFRHGPMIDFRRMLKKQMERLRRTRLARQPGNISTSIPFEIQDAVSRAA